MPTRTVQVEFVELKDTVTRQRAVFQYVSRNKSGERPISFTALVKDSAIWRRLQETEQGQQLSVTLAFGYDDDKGEPFVSDIQPIEQARDAA